jgi:hypothetical protein
MQDQLRAAMMEGNWNVVRRLRRDIHEISPACWMHGPDFCLSA